MVGLVPVVVIVGSGYRIVEVVGQALLLGRCVLLREHGIVAAVIIHRDDRRCVVCLLPCGILGKLLLRVAEYAVEAYFQPFAGFVVKGGTEVQAAVVVFHVHDTVLCQIAHAGRVGRFFRTTGDIQAVIGHHGCAQQFVIPVGIGIELQVFHIASEFGY